MRTTNIYNLFANIHGIREYRDAFYYNKVAWAYTFPVLRDRDTPLGEIMMALDERDVFEII